MKLVDGPRLFVNAYASQLSLGSISIGRAELHNNFSLILCICWDLLFEGRWPVRAFCLKGKSNSWTLAMRSPPGAVYYVVCLSHFVKFDLSNAHQ